MGEERPHRPHQRLRCRLGAAALLLLAAAVGPAATQGSAKGSGLSDDASSLESTPAPATGVGGVKDCPVKTTSANATCALNEDCTCGTGLKRFKTESAGKACFICCGGEGELACNPCTTASGKCTLSPECTCASAKTRLTRQTTDARDCFACVDPTTAPTLAPTAVPTELVPTQPPTAAPSASTPSVDERDYFATKTGCRCQPIWRPKCTGVDQSPQYRGCGMLEPCDGDSSGIWTSWCFIEDGCATGNGEGGNPKWDYCIPDPRTTSTVTTTTVTTTTVYDLSVTKLGCKCQPSWSPVCPATDGGTGSSSATKYSGCGMTTPCDGDVNGGDDFPTWCFVVDDGTGCGRGAGTSGGTSPGVQDSLWDYCRPPVEPGRTRSGCVCAEGWSVKSEASCDPDIVYSGCGMKLPCDGDDKGGSKYPSWCMIDKAKSAASAECQKSGMLDGQFDYCQPTVTADIDKGENAITQLRDLIAVNKAQLAKLGLEASVTGSSGGSGIAEVTPLAKLYLDRVALREAQLAAFEKQFAQRSRLEEQIAALDGPSLNRTRALNDLAKIQETIGSDAAKIFPNGKPVIKPIVPPVGGGGGGPTSTEGNIGEGGLLLCSTGYQDTGVCTAPTTCKDPLLVNSCQIACKLCTDKVAASAEKKSTDDTMLYIIIAGVAFALLLMIVFVVVCCTRRESGNRHQIESRISLNKNFEGGSSTMRGGTMGSNSMTMNSMSRGSVDYNAGSGSTYEVVPDRIKGTSFLDADDDEEATYAEVDEMSGGDNAQVYETIADGDSGAQPYRPKSFSA